MKRLKKKKKHNGVIRYETHFCVPVSRNNETLINRTARDTFTEKEKSFFWLDNAFIKCFVLNIHRSIYIVIYYYNNKQLKLFYGFLFFVFFFFERGHKITSSTRARIQT